MTIDEFEERLHALLLQSTPTLSVALTEAKTLPEGARVMRLLKASSVALQALSPGGRGSPRGGVYLIECSRTRALKIGWARHPESRLAELQTGAPFLLRVVTTFPGQREDETALHRLFFSARIHGEWFGPEIREAALSVFRARGGA